MTKTLLKRLMPAGRRSKHFARVLGALASGAVFLTVTAKAVLVVLQLWLLIDPHHKQFEDGAPPIVRAML